MTPGDPPALVHLLRRRSRWGDLPDAGGGVFAAGGDVFAVRRKGDAEDRAGVPFELGQLLAARQVEDAHGVVLATREDQAAVGGDGEGRNRAQASS